MGDDHPEGCRLSFLDRYERLAVAARRVVLGAEKEGDPACADMPSSPLVGRSQLPGPFVLGRALRVLEATA